MDRRQAIGLFGFAGVAGLLAAPSSRDRLPGIYRLIYWRTTNPDGTVLEPLGPDPIGRITYHNNGLMSVMLMRRNRGPQARVNVQTATIEDLRDAVRNTQAMGSNFVAYMGTFDVDEDRHIVTHRIAGGSSPAFTGANFERRFELTANGLVLSVPPNFNSRLEWERVGDA